MKRAVIFDLDGLLIDSEVVSHQLMDELLRQYGYSLTKAEYARIYSGKTGIGNMTHMIETYHLPLTVAEGMAWEAKREADVAYSAVFFMAVYLLIHSQYGPETVKIYMILWDH